ncbi:MAG: 50S ribosomal protein L25/general stress protein Ctc [Propionibacteriaceae bacterium]|jgi:large subunit ribosomal protein L25|nr:50S ribosomal protein L25/general stress protein Ctc [Propionibacteriaceae bacterium]
MAEIIIAAQVRDEFGKGAARRARRDQLIPAVMYGHGTKPIHVALPAHETTLALRTANALLTIDLPGKTNQMALAKQIQRDPVRRTIEHIDLIIVKRGEKVSVEVPLVLVGEIRGEGIVIQDQNSITLEVEATAIPANIEIDIDGLEAGAVVSAQDLVLPKGAVYQGEPEDLILSVQVPQAKDMGEITIEDGDGETAEEATEE